MRMDEVEGLIDADSYRIDIDRLDPIDRDSSPYMEIEAQIEHWGGGQTPLKFRLDGSGEDWKQQIVYTVGHELSGQPDQTIPVFEISLPGPQGFENANGVNDRHENDGMSAYTSHLRSLFVKEDTHGRLNGLGTVGKCLSLSQDQPVILYLNGIDRVPGRAQSTFFEVLERNPRIQYGIDVEGKAENLYVFSSTDSTADREKIDRKLRSLLGATYTRD
jgi:hypothetical protein